MKRFRSGGTGPAEGLLAWRLYPKFQGFGTGENETPAGVGEQTEAPPRLATCQAWQSGDVPGNLADSFPNIFGTRELNFNAETVSFN
jgi:hypothetical protein